MEAERNLCWDVTRDIITLTCFVDGLTQEVGELRENLAWIRMMRARGTSLGRREPQLLVDLEG